MDGKKCVAALDVGTTGVRCILYDVNAKCLANQYARVNELQEQPGWSEIDANELWEQSKKVIGDALTEAGLSWNEVASIGIATLRSSIVTWSKKTGEPAHRILTWQDTRAKDIAKRWNKNPLLKVVHGLGATAHAMSADRSGRYQAMKIFAFDTLHASVRLRWVLDNVPAVNKLLAEQDLLFGTVDTWLLWKLTGGKVHATDYSNVSATGLYDFYILDWSDFVLKVLDLPRSILPEVRDTSGDFGETAPDLFGGPIPIRSVVGDQQSALFGHCCFKPGDAKCSLGTSMSVSINTGREPRTPQKYVMYPNIAWKIGSELTYACETVSSGVGAVFEWGTSFGLFSEPAAADGIASSVKDSNGVVFVNAFNGLGSPYFDFSAKASLMGLNSGSKPAHVVHALLQSIAFRFADLFEIVSRCYYPRPRTVVVDGGVSRSDFVLQSMSTITGVNIKRSTHHELTALGACYLAGLGIGFWKSKEDLIKNVEFDREFVPKDKTHLFEMLQLWRVAVQRACKWPATVTSGSSEQQEDDFEDRVDADRIEAMKVADV